MRFVDDLLDQARMLAQPEQGPGRPKQASLRRAVSAAYYAIFHEVANQAVLNVMSGQRAASPFGHRVRRTLEHSELKAVAGWFAQNKMPGVIRDLRGDDPVPDDLIAVCDAFVELQEARHRADYDLSTPFTKLDTKHLVDAAHRAVRLLRDLPPSEDRSIFLSACLFGDRRLVKNK